jgi:hypothetical protein
MRLFLRRLHLTAAFPLPTARVGVGMMTVAGPFAICRRSRGYGVEREERKNQCEQAAGPHARRSKTRSYHLAQLRLQQLRLHQLSPPPQSVTPPLACCGMTAARCGAHVLAGGSQEASAAGQEPLQPPAHQTHQPLPLNASKTGNTCAAFACSSSSGFRMLHVA